MTAFNQRSAAADARNFEAEPEAPAPARANDITHRLIPGGAHTYSKGDDQFPSNAPRYLERGEGAYVWDRDDRRYVDWTMGLRSMALGYGIKPVIEAAIEQMWKGSNFGRPSYIETEYAEALTNHLPAYAEMVKYGKNGSNVTTAAVKLARAYTGREYVALCKDHPFFSFDDWFIGTTQMDGGIPADGAKSSLTFPYGDLAAMQRLFDEHPQQIACVIMEAATSAHPPKGYLEGVRDLCTRNGTVFIIDEMITGFRWHAKGAQAYYGVEADLATFGKGMANGFSLAVLAGKREIMQLGGLDHDRPRVFLISTTHGAENHALAAALATLKIFQHEPVTERMWAAGGAMIEGLNGLAAEAGLAANIKAGGVPCSPTLTFLDRDGKVSMPLRTLFLQEMVERGVIINYLAPGYSHRDEHIDASLEAARAALGVCARALDSGIDRFLRGPVVKPVFRKFN